jgi:hypothetical protein
MQQGHLLCIHDFDSVCLQIGQVQTCSFSIAPGVVKEESLILSVKGRFCSFDLTPTYNQYAKSDTPTVMSIRLNTTERSVSKVTPNARMIIARTRIQRSGVR